MYKPVDRHGSLMWTYSTSTEIEFYKKKIEELEQENDQLRKKVKKLENEKDFILDGLM